MAYPTVLLPLDDDPRADVRDDEAAQFALRFGHHLHGLSCHRPVPAGATLAAAMGGLADSLTLELEREQQRAVEREQRFQALCARRGVASFETEVDDTEDSARAILRRAPLQDLLLLGQPDPSDREFSRRRATFEDVVLHSPRPCLVLPYAGHIEDLCGTVLVAWDGSSAAARAAADALPLLRRARHVRLVQFDRSAGESGRVDQAPLQAPVQWLARHGIIAHPSVCFARGDVGNALLSHAADVGADLLVMGSWGHARWAERLLGGATQTVMASMTLPVLTSR